MFQKAMHKNSARSFQLCTWSMRSALTVQPFSNAQHLFDVSGHDLLHLHELIVQLLDVSLIARVEVQLPRLLNECVCTQAGTPQAQQSLPQSGKLASPRDTSRNGKES